MQWALVGPSNSTRDLYMVLRAGSVTARDLEGRELLVELTGATEVQGCSKADEQRQQGLCSSQHSSVCIENHKP